MKERIRFYLLFLLVLLFAITACGMGGKQGEPQGMGGMKIRLKPPDNVQSGQKAQYTVEVTDDNSPVTGAEVVVNLEMTEMDHGKNGFRAAMTKPGQYEGQAVLPMGGDWIAYVKVKKGGQERTEPFPFKASGHMLSPEEMRMQGLNEDGSIKNTNF